MIDNDYKNFLIMVILGVLYAWLYYEMFLARKNNDKLHNTLNNHKSKKVKSRKNTPKTINILKSIKYIIKNIFLMMIIAFSYIYVILKYNRGIIRLYMQVAIFIGVIIFIKLALPIIRVIDNMLVSVKRALKNFLIRLKKYLPHFRNNHNSQNQKNEPANKTNK